MAKVYLYLHEQMSFVWGFLYNSKLVLLFSLPLRKFIASFKSKRVLAILREFQPAIVISTQTIPSGIISYLKAKGLYRGKLVVVFSDYHLHRFWLYKEADLYICNIEEQALALKRLGVGPDRIALTGTIIADRYLKKISKQEAAGIFGLFLTMPTILISGGSRGLLNTKEICLSLMRSPKAFQIVVVTGKNEQLQKELEQISAPINHPFKVLGFVNNQEVLMSASDLMIGKVGGPTIAEAVAKGLPMILTNPHPGHETANLEYLVRNGIVAFGRIPKEVAFLAQQILERKLTFKQEERFRKIIKPPNAISVLEAISGMIKNLI